MGSLACSTVRKDVESRITSRAIWVSEALADLMGGTNVFILRGTRPTLVERLLVVEGTAHQLRSLPICRSYVLT